MRLVQSYEGLLAPLVFLEVLEAGLFPGVAYCILMRVYFADLRHHLEVQTT